jgi:putative NADH-flavin reductase
MRIVVFGASGKVGRVLVRQALEREYDVTAFVHKNNPFVEEPRVHVVKGDIYSGEDIRLALQGSKAVISCLGSWGTKHRNVLTAAMQSIIPAMVEQRISRIITLTGAGAAPPDKELSAFHKLLMKVLKPFPAGKVFADGEEHMRLLLRSELDWTTIRSPIMSNRNGKEYTLKLENGTTLPTVGREAVAASMLDQLKRSEWSRQAPALSR